MSFLKGVLTGLAIGYLTAPRSGKETRDKLTKQANDLQHQWEDGVASVKSQVDRLVGNAEAKANEFANQTERKVDQFKSTYDQDRAKTAYNDTVDETADAAKSGINDAENALKFN